MNTISAVEFGNKVQSCGTEDAKIFFTSIGSNLYAEDKVEYLLVYYCKKLNSLKHLVRTTVAELHN